MSQEFFYPHVTKNIKKIIAIDNDDEFDKQYDDFTDEYGDCIVVVKNNKN